MTTEPHSDMQGIWRKLESILTEVNKSGVGMARIAGELKVLNLTLQHQAQALIEHKTQVNADIASLETKISVATQDIQKLKDNRTWLMGAAAALGFIASLAFNFLRTLGVRLG